MKRWTLHHDDDQTFYPFPHFIWTTRSWDVPNSSDPNTYLFFSLLILAFGLHLLDLIYLIMFKNWIPKTLLYVWIWFSVLAAFCFLPFYAIVKLTDLQKPASRKENPRKILKPSELYFDKSFFRLNFPFLRSCR